MKTHKNPELRASSVVKASDKPAAKAAPKAASAPAVKKPPVCALQGKKWIVVSQLMPLLCRGYMTLSPFPPPRNIKKATRVYPSQTPLPSMPSTSSAATTPPSGSQERSTASSLVSGCGLCTTFVDLWFVCYRQLQAYGSVFWWCHLVCGNHQLSGGTGSGKPWHLSILL